MNTLSKLKKEIVKICNLLYEKNFIKSTDGNVSVRIGENKILITPTNKSKFQLNPKDLVIIDLNGKKISGKLNPSGEFRLHTTIYQCRKDVNAIIHAHPIYSTAFSVSGIDLMQNVLPEVVITLGGVPLTEYATLYTEELPQSILKYVFKYNAILLKNHGVVTFDKDLFSAYYKLEKVEHLAQIIYISKTLGRVDTLTKKQVESLVKIKNNLKL